jgi:DNA ligase-1
MAMFIKPMLLETIETPMTGSNVMTQLKYDGIRLQADFTEEKPKLYSKPGNNITAKFPELLMGNVEKGTILDGELVVFDEKGKSDFEAMNARFLSKKRKDKVTYMVFDVLQFRGKSVLRYPLWQRQEMLKEAFTENEFYRRVQNVIGDPIRFFELVKQNGLEGCVQKYAESIYRPGERGWYKIINYTEAEVFITGFWKNKFGWLMGVEDNGLIRHAGTLELGVGEVERRAVYPILKGLVTGESKFHVYVQPRIKCRVKFRNWTKTGLMRLAVFQGFVL